MVLFDDDNPSSITQHCILVWGKGCMFATCFVFKYELIAVIRIVVFDGSTAIQTLISFCIQTSIQNHCCECFCFPAEEFNQDLDNEGWTARL